MSNPWPKILRDPVHNLIAFHDNAWDRLILALLDTREVQRLRRIKQLGFSELVFPGANHSRFAHSVGVLHVTKKFLDQFDMVRGTRPDEHHRSLILAAALLHDIGHGPFSHAFEKVTEIKHERYTKEIIENRETQVNQVLRAADPKLPDDLARLFAEEAEDGSLPSLVPLYLTHVISSQFDADRCDYLLRDSFATGTDYGRYDLDWLLSHVQPQDDDRRFFLTRKALPAAETYIFARFRMYRTVYFHKTTRAAEVMLKLLFRRCRELLGTSPSGEEAMKLLPEAPRSVLALFSGQPALACYTRIDEHSITEFLKACSECQDSVIKTLGCGIVDRQLYKVIDATSASAGRVGEFTVAVQSLLSGELAPGYLFENDSPADTPYKPYDPDVDKPAAQIFVENQAGKSVEISTLAPTTVELRKQHELNRYYFPERLRTQIEAIAQATLWKK